jgi:D-glutamate N-acetyltransferase
MKEMVHDMSARLIVILTDGRTNPVNAKTASCVIRYKPEEVVALLDTTQPGKTSQELLGVGGDIPVVASLADAPSANTLLIGIAPAGGKLPPAWRKILLEAVDRGMNLVSGLHDFLSNDPEISAAAAKRGVEIHDVRKNNERDVANRKDLREDCLRIHTVGQDCSVGKMLASVEIAIGLKKRGHDAKFVATGQTGIMIEGDGCPVDCVVSDFVNGAVEKLVLANQQHDILLVEGQGSLSHPRYSSVTLGLLHGCAPHGLILVYEAGRKNVLGMDYVPLTPLAKIVEVNEMMAQLAWPKSRVIGVAMNSRLLAPDDAEKERERVRRELGVPVCDVIRHGPADMVDAVLALRQELFPHLSAKAG